MCIRDRGSPGLREAIEAQLEQNYSSLLARSENPQYVAGFESVRDQIIACLLYTSRCV